MASSTDWVAKSYDAAADQTKQLITLSTAVLTLTATFLNNFLENAKHRDAARNVLIGSWAVLAVSIVIGLLVLGGLVGNMATVDGATVTQPPNLPKTDPVAIAQWVTFVAGLVLAVVASFVAIHKQASECNYGTTIAPPASGQACPATATTPSTAPSSTSPSAVVVSPTAATKTP